MSDRSWSERNARDPRDHRGSSGHRDQRIQRDQRDQRDAPDAYDRRDRGDVRDPRGSVPPSRDRDRPSERPTRDRRYGEAARDGRDRDGRDRDGRERDGYSRHPRADDRDRRPRDGWEDERAPRHSSRHDGRAYDRSYDRTDDWPDDDERYREERYREEPRGPFRDRSHDERPSASRHHHHHDREDDGYRRGEGYDGERYDDRSDSRGGYDGGIVNGERYSRGRDDRAPRPTRPRGPRDPRDPYGSYDAYGPRQAADPWRDGSAGGYGQPGAPWAGYGQPAARTHPFAGEPATVPLPPRDGSPRPVGGRTVQRRNSRRGLWITLGALAALVLVLGGGGAYAYVQYRAPGAAASAFCGALKADDAATAYGQLAASEQAQLTEQQFSQGMQALMGIEGAVLTCAASTSGAGYGYQLGAAAATVSVVISRAMAGTLRGNLTLTNENGAWKIARLDTRLLGADPGALATASAFCAALRSQDYPAAYALLANGIGQQQQDFTQAAQTHDQIDGLVTGCAPVSLGQFQSAAGSSLTLSVTRAKLAARKGTVTLADATNSWQITGLDSVVLGTDLGPLQVGTRFCADLASGSYTAAFTLLSPNGKGGETADQFAAQIALPSPFAWGGCTPDLRTYTVTGNAASYTTAILVLDTATGQSSGASLSFDFVNINGTWLLDTLQKA